MKTIISRVLVTVCVFNIWTNISFGQTEPSTKEFWSAVQMNYNLDQIHPELKSMLFQIAIQETNSVTLAQAKLETMSEYNEFQEAVFFYTYTHNHNSREWLRLILSNLCGSYSLGNPIADYVFAKYSKDPRALKIIAELTKKNEEENEAAEIEQKKKSKKEEREINVYNYVEDMPKFKENVNVFFNENMRFPKEARDKNIDGRVIIKFVVNEDSTISDATIVRGIGSGCDEEAIRLINSMSGKWEPGKQNGKAVKVYFTLPIVFNSK